MIGPVSMPRQQRPLPSSARHLAISMLVMVGVLAAAIPTALAETQSHAVAANPAVTRHRVTRTDGIEIFYREAGAANAPAVLLLHGFPTSSHMFRNLIPALAHRYRVIAPDYPAFGHSGTRSRTASRASPS